MKLFDSKFNIFVPGGLIENIAQWLNSRRRWYDRYITELDCETENIIQDADTFIATAKRLWRGENVSRGNMNTFLKVACQHYLERVKPESIDSTKQRNAAKEIIALARDFYHG